MTEASRDLNHRLLDKSGPCGVQVMERAFRGAAFLGR